MALRAIQPVSSAMRTPCRPGHPCVLSAWPCRCLRVVYPPSRRRLRVAAPPASPASQLPPTASSPTARRGYSTEAERESVAGQSGKNATKSTRPPIRSDKAAPSSTESGPTSSPPPYDWEEEPNFDIQKFTDLPYSNFGVNQHILINQEFKEALRQILWKFRAPIRYAFAYGSGVFPQSKGGAATEAEFRRIHPKVPPAIQKAQDGSPKMIDFIFGVSYTQHWHSLNLMQNRHHYSLLGSLGSGAVARVQDKWGAGVYFNPYVVVDGVLVKYGVVNLDTLCKDLSEWNTLYLAGRLHKPVKILRDDPRVRLANQINLLSALRTALLLLPSAFTERELYNTIAGISYMGDPRMAFPTENPEKVTNIVGHNMQNFRRLYAPLVEALPNVTFDDPARSEPDWVESEDAVMKLKQDMDPVKRGNMVRRLPRSFRGKLYFEYQKKYKIPQLEFNRMMEESKNEDVGSFKKQEGGRFEQRIAQEPAEGLRGITRGVIRKTINWPSTSQSLKSGVTAGCTRTVRYIGEKVAKYREGRRASKNTESAGEEKRGEEKKRPD